MIIALALFTIAMLAVIPTLSQAGRNMSFAIDAYDGHLQAQRLMLTVRGALTDGVNPQARAIQYVDGGFEFSIWIFGRYAQEFHSANRPDANAAVSGINTSPSHGSTIVTVIWCEDGRVLGRAIGMVYS